MHSCTHFVGLWVVIVERVVAALRVCRTQENVGVQSSTTQVIRSEQMHIRDSIHTDSA